MDPRVAEMSPIDHMRRDLDRARTHPTFPQPRSLYLGRSEQAYDLVRQRY